MDCRLQRSEATLAVGTGGSHSAVFPLDLKLCPTRKFPSSSRGLRTSNPLALTPPSQRALSPTSSGYLTCLSDTLCVFYSAICPLSLAEKP